jgi:hypothetical protein
MFHNSSIRSKDTDRFFIDPGFLVLMETQILTPIQQAMCHEGFSRAESILSSEEPLKRREGLRAVFEASGWTRLLRGTSLAAKWNGLAFPDALSASNYGFRRTNPLVWISGRRPGMPVWAGWTPALHQCRQNAGAHLVEVP